MTSGIAFDAFGTLFDLEALRPRLGDELFDAWAPGLVPASWHATVAGRVRPFVEIAALGLRTAARGLGTTMSEEEAQGHASALAVLPAFGGVREALAALAPLPLALLTNGAAASGERLLAGAGLDDLVPRVLAAESVGAFKPSPEVYALARDALGPGDVWLVTANDWDVTGAAQAGLRTAWVARGRPVIGYLGVEPDVVVGELGELADALPQPR